MFFILLLFTTFSFGIGLEEAMQTALEKNPSVKAMEEEVKSFEGLFISAGAFPNPEVRLESGFITNDKNGRPEGRFLYLLEFNQPIPMWGTRSIGREVVRKERESFESAVEFRKRRLLAQVYRAFYRALWSKELLKIRKDSLRTAKAVEEFVRKAYSLGEVTELELLRAERERGIEEVQLEVARSRYRAELKVLSGLLNTDVDEVEGNLFRVPNLRDVSYEELPEVKALSKKAQAFEERIRLERARAKPSLGAGFVVEDADGYYGLRGSLTLELPAFYRRQGEIIRYSALKRAVLSRKEARVVMLRRRIEALKLQMETLDRELKRIDNRLLPQARKELELALRSYRLGAITLLELSDVRRRYYELLIKRAELSFKMHEVYSQFIEIGGWR